MKTSKLDLPLAVHNAISLISSSIQEVEEVKIFGSRVLGNAKRGSDVDLAVYGTKVSQQSLHKIHDYLAEDTNFPYFFDVVHYNSLKNTSLKQHIKEFGISIYKKKPQSN